MTPARRSSIVKKVQIAAIIMAMGYIVTVAWSLTKTHFRAIANTAEIKELCPRISRVEDAMVEQRIDTKEIKTNMKWIRESLEKNHQ